MVFLRLKQMDSWLRYCLTYTIRKNEIWWVEENSEQFSDLSQFIDPEPIS